jgi:aromatic-L-amino-acid decarboxylase
MPDKRPFDLNARTYKDLSPEAFKKHAIAAVEWIGRFFENMDQFPVMSQVQPGDIKNQLPAAPPEHAEQFEKILADYEQIIVPGMTHWNHPRFHAWFSVTGSAPGIIGEMLIAALNVNAMLWKSSPAATELEEVVMDWLRQMAGLPPEFEGVINDSASSSTLYAMAAAREAAGLQIREKGMAGRSDLPALRFYTSTEAHSSVEKAAITLGIGQNGLCKIPTNTIFQMDATALEQAIKADISQGIKPLGVIATTGTTSTTSVDPVDQIASICRRYQIWLHVDAAYGGPVAVLPEKRYLFKGWELADSIVLNPHKWLFTQLDCSALYCRKPEILKQAFSLVPEYLKTTEGESVKNLMDYGVSLGRRFRALKLWMIIRTFGQSGIQDIIREHLEFAQKLAQLIEAHPDFDILVPVPFSTLVFRFVPANHSEKEIDNLNEKLLEQINKTGQVFLSHTKIHGKFALRLAIGNIKTKWGDLAVTWELVQTEAKKIS